MLQNVRRIAVMTIVAVVALAACKKESHPLNPNPGDQRLNSFSKLTTKYDRLNKQPILGYVPVKENYAFTYDLLGRINTITYTTNDVTVPNTISELTYKNDTIYDTIRYLNRAVKEVDTFITDYRGYVVRTHMLGKTTNYQYFGNLLSRVEYADTDYVTYRAYNNNFTRSVPSVTSRGSETTYTVYTDLDNRVGDFFGLESLARYGYNFYMYKKLIRSQTTIGFSAYVDYKVDAYQRISQTRVAYLLADSVSVIYDIQYQDYK